MDKITARILRNIGEEGLVEKLQFLSPSDLNTLLLDVMRGQKFTPGDTLKRYEENRYCAPSGFDAIAYRRFELQLLELAHRMDLPSLLLRSEWPP